MLIYLDRFLELILSCSKIFTIECTDQHYKEMAVYEIIKLMQANTDGLTIITQGGGEMLYARKGSEIKTMKPFNVEVKSTLGVGDT